MGVTIHALTSAGTAQLTDLIEIDREVTPGNWTSYKNTLQALKDLFAYAGTANRITITGSAIDISASYVGQNSITTLGTIGTGTWQGTAIADAYIASAAAWNAYATTKERKSTQAAISGTDIDWSAATHFYKTLSANTTFTFSNDSNADTIIIKIVQGASAYTVTWPSGVKWADGIEPVMSTSNGAVDVYTLTKIGSEILGSYVQNMS